jgi:hypothetical protein
MDTSPIFRNFWKVTVPDVPVRRLIKIGLTDDSALHTVSALPWKRPPVNMLAWHRGRVTETRSHSRQP